MNAIYNRVFSFFNTIQSKIVFYPALLGFLGFFVAILMIYLEDLGISNFIIEEVPILMVNDGRTALTLLSVCVTGLISMMVFSFSMVMVLLNQAANNYSPRLLPDLISDKKHQIILGIYLSSILFCIFTLFSIQPTGDQFRLPGFSILIGIVLTVFCLCCFIYFLHSISQRIQINNILDNIYFEAKERLHYLISKEKDSGDSFPDTEQWYSYNSEKSNYLQNISIKNLIAICTRENIRIRVLPVKGNFILKGLPLFKSDKELDEKTVKQILTNFNFSKEELVSDNYILAFKQLTEIIIKAMSPAINDPGTAVNGIDYLSELFAIRMKRGDQEVICHKGSPIIRIATVNFEELMYNVMASLRTYCINDIIIIQKLAMMLLYLKKQDAVRAEFHKTVNKETETFLEAARSAISNKADLETLDQITHKIRIEQ